MPELDPVFLALPLAALADAALQRARDNGATYASFRLARIRTQTLRLRDARPLGSAEDEQTGYAVRVVVDGTWGFAAGTVRSPAAATAVADQAIAVARACRPVNTESVLLADEPGYGQVSWVSPYLIDPFDVADTDKTALLSARSAQLLTAPGVSHVDAFAMQVRESIYYADLAGTTACQQRVRMQSALTAIAVDPVSGAFDSMRTLAPPVARGWEHATGASGWDWDGELAELPELLAEKRAAPSVQPGSYDLVVHPSNLWLTIHESIGHATELDRALGYEANYAGTSFATPNRLGTLRYGSAIMNVTGDRTTEHGLASIGWDDDGVAAQSWDLVHEGTLVGYQLDRSTAARAGLARSNGCSYADAGHHFPIQRMANVSLHADPAGGSTEELIAGVERGIFVIGDKSWSIDMQRYNFQFTGQRFFAIRGGRLAGQLRDVAYQATTTDFWGSLAALGGPQTYVLGGAFNCGKGQPGQVASVSHGCPSAVFTGVNILNAISEGGK